jgi:phospholipid-binding lipoprotein MlaA
MVAALAFAAPAQAQSQDGVEPSPAGDAAEAQYDNNDPWEGLNRRLYAVNEGVDRVVLEPVARGYRAVTPGFFRAGVSNVLRNLRAPVIFTNDVLQGEFGRAGTTAARFGMNSTFGLLGLVDVAADAGLEHHDEDFGQTLAVWGVPSGPYIFVPIFGPTTLRDGVGRAADNGFDPLTYADFQNVEDVRTGRGVATGVSVREQLLDPIESVRSTSIDPYATIRNNYFLTRESAIRNGLQDVQDLPEFEDIPSEDDPEALDTPPSMPEPTPE